MSQLDNIPSIPPGSMDKKNDTIDEVIRFLEIVNKHLKEKNCKRISIEVVKEFVAYRIAFNQIK